MIVSTISTQSLLNGSDPFEMDEVGLKAKITMTEKLKNKKNSKLLKKKV